MFEARIAAAPLTIAMRAGFPPEIDALAQRGRAGHRFLRAAWFRAGAEDRGQTLLVQRDNGALVAAIPTCNFGPALLGARKVPGSYWPFRSIVLAADADVHELAHALDHPCARGLGAVWRLGPARSDDPATAMLAEAAQLAGWHVLSREAGAAWLIDLDRLRTAGWPRSSTARRLRAAWRKLEALGTPRWRHVRGKDWNDSVLEDMGRIEAQSWIARTTDGSGAKFMHSAHRQMWRVALADPVIADSLCATILMLGERPVAFSFDCDDGAWQYGIAGSYVEDLAHCNIGKLVNYRALEDAIADGQSVMDMGAGDGGYKRAMGAAEGYALTDLLFVRSRIAARMLERVWCRRADAAREGGHG
ncbi:MAG: GNAT family N-acetyltransferase [Erythrobacter sp.]|jgi:CelD/BcsL family acetyltransferase involved in cellulose biosynthesis|nr:GNAT family N-acetyltransferase [Erythrobacter sp.]